MWNLDACEGGLDLVELAKILGDFLQKEGNQCYVYGTQEDGLVVNAIVNLRKMGTEVLWPGKCNLTEYIFLLKAEERLQKILDGGAHILMDGRYYYITESETYYFKDAPFYIKLICKKEGFEDV
ncbi:MAG: hypothetical protein LBJ83_01025 [Oscillospiraceae bacterium]|nr:hypothetical protein [Oscillospiraceae bacterium]